MAVDTSIIVAGVGVAGITATTIVSISTCAAFIFGHRKAYKSPTIYSDKDGVSTEELSRKHSSLIQKIVLALGALAGLGISCTLAILATVVDDDGFLVDNYLNLAGAALLFAQSVLVMIAKEPSQIYDLGLQATISAIFLMCVLFTQLALAVQDQIEFSNLVFGFRIGHMATVIVTGFAGVLFEARPDVFTTSGKLVDRQFTKSALSHYTFSWCTHVLDLALKNGSLDLSDLPRPDHLTRSKELAETWLAADRKQRLWIQVFLAHKYAFIFQWTLTLLQSFGNVAPQFMLYHILKVLEDRDEGLGDSSAAWIWVIALGASQIIASWVEAWIFWISFAQLAGPVRAQLSALIFRKSMRRKDVKGDVATKKSAITAENPNDAMETNPQAGPGIEAAPEPPATDKKADEEGKEEKLGKSTQSTVNLIGVDTKRVSDFTSFNNFFPGSVFKLTVSFWFLIDIIGWKALGAGLLSMAVIIPINIFFSKRYAAAQGKLMEVRDEKEAAVSEALRGIRQIKFGALEARWQLSLDAIRNRELDTLWLVFVSDTALMFCWISSPIILSATALAVYSIQYTLTPSIAFVAIGIFNTLQVTLSVIPELTTDLLDALISVNRIEEYLQSPEIQSVEQKHSDEIIFDNASFAFPSDIAIEDAAADDERFMLRNVTVTFPAGELSVISGKTGSGKSLLLNAILREVDISGGAIYLPRAPKTSERRDDRATKANWLLDGAYAYVAQVPWIENATVKDNILFNLPEDKERYEKTIEASALKKDFDMLPDGDKTEIGQNGINLSGGQKWRLSFARALYSRATILILDDIFSAVDAHVGRHLFEKALTGELGQGRTRILVTHHVALVKSRTKYLVELGEGTVLNAGLLSELEEDGTLSKIESHVESSQELDRTAVNSEAPSDGEESENGAPLKKIDTKADARKFVEEETKEKGGVKARLYGQYLKSSGGYPFWMFAVFIFLSQQALSLGRQWWLKEWTQSNEDSMVNSMIHANFYVQSSRYLSTTMRTTGGNDHLICYLSGYVGISLLSAFIGAFIFFFLFTGSIKASKDLFSRMLFTVLRANLRWHDTVPLGRILNRFTADFNILDSRLGLDIGFSVNAVLKLIGIVIAGIIVSPYVLIGALLLFGVCLYFARKFVGGAREVKRLESIAKSPIFSQFGSSLTGISTIRAYGKADIYVESMSSKIDDHTSTFWHLWLFNRWFSWRMTTIGGLFSGIVAALIISIPGIDAALSGFALFFALEYSGAITWAVRHVTNLELEMNAAERIVEYAQLPTESLDGVSPPAAWPTDGRMEVHNLSVTYAPDLPCVLRNLSFTIERNERVGVVGRTGAGKSSMTLAIFRFLEAQTGSIHIDGIDISTIKLEALRSRLSIIPQDPVLFSGTIRSNLDPFDEHTDTELLDALKRVHLIGTSGSATPLPATQPTAANSSNSSSITAPLLTLSDEDKNSNIFKSLSSEITSAGLNLSQGQRQLLCLARALVARPKVMVLDEATSAVDMATDALIQRSIREEFTDSTLIVIAHRLSTIADFDKILVLDAGEVREFGSPRELMENGGAFRMMVQDSGEADKLEKLILGEA